MEQRKKFNLGKIAFNSTRKINSVDVEIALRDTAEGPVFSASGSIWNRSHTDMICGGQCLDTIAAYIKTPLFKEIYKLWKKWHLNDMHAGVRIQEEAVSEYLAKGNKYEFDEVCNYLKSKNLYEVDGYRYGSSWIYESIDEADLDKINALLAMD